MQRLEQAPDPTEARRFRFGENWQGFVATLDAERIAEAKRSFMETLDIDSLAGGSMLDIGSGSGLFSLAALQLGAERVHSFDYDPESVACGTDLRRQFADRSRWTVERGDVLDRDYVESLGTFDLVYAWGVLHHTGDMSTAMENAARAVAPGGRLFISIYNDQGSRSVRWRRIKRTYNGLPRSLQTPFMVGVMAPSELRAMLSATVRLAPQTYVQSWTHRKRNRGMSRWYDWRDWCGGYPFEVAKPEEVFDFYRARGFHLEKLTTCGGGYGCNEFVFAQGNPS